MLGRIATGHLIIRCHRFGQGDADFSFTCGNENGARAAQRWGVTHMSAAGKNAQLGIAEARLLNDLSGVFNIRADD